MRRLDGGDDGDVRRRDRAEPRHLAEVVGGHLHDGDPVFRQQLSQRDGQAVEAVVVRPVLEDREGAAQHGRDRLFGRGLADAAGDAHDLRRLLGEDEARPILDRLPRIRHDDARGVVQVCVEGLLAEDAGRAAPQRVGDVVVPVGAVGPDREEELAGLHQSRVVAE